MNQFKTIGQPPKLGLYDPDTEKDSCGVGFICDIKGRPSRQIIEDARDMNCCMEHRGGVGYEKNTGDGAGMLLGLPDKFLRKIAKSDFGVDLPFLDRNLWDLLGVTDVLLDGPQSGFISFGSSTPVKRMSRPWCLTVSRRWSRPSRCSIVACRSRTWATSSTAL